MKDLVRWIEDQILVFIQRRCKHPGEMVAVDILEGSGDYEVAYCRREIHRRKTGINNENP